MCLKTNILSRSQFGNEHEVAEEELRHALFLARKNRAASSEIARIKRAIQSEKRRHPGFRPAGRFLHRPVTMLEPGMLKLEWNQMTPGKKTLNRCLARYTNLLTAETQEIDTEKPMSDHEFTALLAVLLSRDDRMEAMKLVRRHLGCDLVAAKAYIEKARQAG